MRAIPEAAPRSSWSDCCVHSGSPDWENRSGTFHYLRDDYDKQMLNSNIKLKLVAPVNNLQVSYDLILKVQYE